jgi:hypothetical protein
LEVVVEICWMMPGDDDDSFNKSGVWRGEVGICFVSLAVDGLAGASAYEFFSV